jgi:hypothetical protein
MSAKDKEELVLNPVTKKLDTVRSFNENRIVTHEKNSVGNPLVMFDPVAAAYVSLDFLTVTDNDGNVVVL